jgi:predicted type IV restriction endonuclease
MEKWKEKNRPHASKLLKEYTLQLMAEAKPPDDHDEIIQKGEALIQNQKLQNS